MMTKDYIKAQWRKYEESCRDYYTRQVWKDWVDEHKEDIRGAARAAACSSLLESTYKGMLVATEHFGPFSDITVALRGAVAALAKEAEKYAET